MVVKRKRKRQMNLTLNDVKKLKVQKVVVYDRISSKMQEKYGRGIETQEFEIMKWINYNLPNAEIVEIITDKAQSAYKIPLRYRENGKRLWQNVPNWKNYNDGKKLIPNALLFNIIVVFEGSRLFRDTDESTPSYTFFEENDIFVISVSDNKLNTFIGGSDKTLRKVKEVLDEAESDTKSARMTASKDLGREDGRFTGGQLPYGFTWDKVNKKIIEIEDQIEVYKMIFHKYLYEDKGAVVIARELNEMQIPFVDNHHGKRISKWNDQNVRNLLINPILTGRIQYKKYIEIFDEEKGRIIKKRRDILDEQYIKKHKDLKEHISYEMWRKVVEKLASRNNKKIKRSFSPRTYILTGYVKCPHCSEIMKGQNKGGKDKNGEPRIYYICSNNLCTGYPKSFPKNLLEKEVIRQIKEYLYLDENDIENIKKEIQTFIESESVQTIEAGNIEKEISNIQKSLDSLENQMDESVKNGTPMNLTTYLELKEKYTNMIAEKQKELFSLNNQNKNRENAKNNFDQALEAIESLYNFCDNYTEENQPLYRKIIQLLVKEVVKKDGRITVVFNEELNEDGIIGLEEFMNDELFESFKEISATIENFGTHTTPIHGVMMYTPVVYQHVFYILNNLVKI